MAFISNTAVRLLFSLPFVFIVVPLGWLIRTFADPHQLRRGKHLSSCFTFPQNPAQRDSRPGEAAEPAVRSAATTAGKD